MENKITRKEYSALQKAYDFFNTRLFDGALPQVMITMQRRSKAGGFFHRNRFSARVEDGITHEVALNPDHFQDRSDEWILSVLVHEMAHVWEVVENVAPKSVYHTRKWAEKMKELGLQPSHTGEPGGKETGPRMSHYVIPEGPFQRACRRLIAEGFVIAWQSVTPTRKMEAIRKKKAASKTKYSCPTCRLNVWAKPQTLLICGGCLTETRSADSCVLAPAA